MDFSHNTYRRDQIQRVTETRRREMLPGNNPVGRNCLPCGQFSPMTVDDTTEREAKRARFEQSKSEADSSPFNPESLTFSPDDGATGLGSVYSVPRSNHALVVGAEFDDQSQLSPLSAPWGTLQYNHPAVSAPTYLPSGIGAFPSLSQGNMSNEGFFPSGNNTHSPIQFQYSGPSSTLADQYSFFDAPTPGRSEDLSPSNIAYNGSSYESNVDCSVRSPASSQQLDSSGINSADYLSPGDGQFARDQSLEAPPSISFTNEEPWTTLNTYFAPELGYNPLPLAPSDISGISFLPGQPPRSSLSQPLFGGNLPPQDTFGNAVNQSRFSAGMWDSCTISLSSNRHFGVQNVGSSDKQKKGRRQGSLGTTKAKKVNQIRKRGACCYCRSHKTSCSTGLPCLRCKNRKPSPWSGKLCIVTRLEGYIELFFPHIVTARLAIPAVEKLLKESTLGCTSNAIDVQLSSGSKYPPMSFTVHEFTARHNGVNYFDYIQSPVAKGKKTFTRSFGPPICLLMFDSKIIKAECLKHVKMVSKMQRDPGETARGDTSIVVWKATNAVIRYEREIKRSGKRKDALLRQATMLYTMNYIISRLILLTADSAKGAVAKLRSPAPPYRADVLTSNILNIQVKHHINELLAETLTDVLKSFDRLLMSVKGDKSTWASSFGIMLMICTCIESVQVATDSFVVSRMRNNQDIEFSREGYFFQLERQAFEHCVELFHHVYKTRKGGARGFNPIRDGLRVDLQKGITQQAVDLVNEMKQILKLHENDIRLRMKDPSFEITPTTPDLLTSHMDLRVQVSGRLVSKFLWTFLKV